ncbi:MAG: hypothetical protein FD150_1956 [Rhodobacteraceae bacterium]|nr:MAG: hypothetical protein FD150_1956 [Paracoccaceae bacterium]
MAMRLRPALVLAVGFAGPLGADTGLGCRQLGDVFTAMTSYSLTLPPAPNVEAACVVDDAVLQAEGGPKITVKRLELSGTGVDGMPDSLSLVVKGLRVTPALLDRTMDPRLRDALRLQTVDVRLMLRQGTLFEGLELRGGVIALSGGTEVRIEADLKGAGFEAGTLLSALLTALDLEWKADGRLLRPAMEAVGERLTDGATGDAAVEAARQGLLAVIANLPGEMLTGDTAKELAALVEALPQGRGRMALGFDAGDGIGAARLAIAALSDDPVGETALAKLFAGTALLVDWTPGIVP